MPWIGAIDLSAIVSDSDEDNDTGPVGNPVLVDRHGFMLAPGNTVTKIADGTRFVVTTVERLGHNPIVWTLYDDNNTSVSAMTVMLDDTERHGRASYCRHCENHFNACFDWQRGCGRCT